jgi:ParB family transcriptional regulator, chromosome partitioning protein
MHRPHLLPREGLRPYRQDRCREAQARADQHGLRTAAGGKHTLPRNKYTEIRSEKPTTKEEATRPEFKTCKYPTEAIVSDGIDKGELRKVCTEPTCPVHHPKKQSSADDAKWKAEQEKQRKEAAIANTTGIRILAAITAGPPA